jgi:xylulokinase
MHTLVMLGEDQRPLRPAILWNDSRGAAECDFLLGAIPAIAEITGVAPAPGFTAAKLLWVRNQEPDCFARMRTMLLPKDYVRLQLTGEIATDVSDAAGTQLFDEAERCWAPAVVDAVGLDASRLPPVVEGTEIAGRVTPAAAARLGLPAGLPVAAGGGDAGTGAVGLGFVDAGSCFVSLGTAATYVTIQDSYGRRPRAFCTISPIRSRADGIARRVC